ncbi:RelA/SpoT domain-containing protein [Synechococcus sp. RedBA-s]|uniref:RelA/SpoT domain-containing protein n=1 Tax=Synechococcus sp. RedBA-s TaxID=2823741 RepID=UPI0020CBC3B3|nr:RelA/SpoT domain-containing protein [Synechococcus sp. RedBA-s]MCP9799882.1 RelA/SpoT domain-containing protein [Synechococcus sp. RedBA-s]
MNFSKTRIDKAGRALARDEYRSEEEYFDLEEVFDEYRKLHLAPLSLTTLEIQNWLAAEEGEYCIAQRLKRKPQIVRKLKRLNTRLSQLQDIAGLRIVVENNYSVDELLRFLRLKVSENQNFEVRRETDYRGQGRDDTGYRAVHFLIEREGFSIELQIRSKQQHYWSETIERTSVIYGYYLKEGEGDQTVLTYFKQLSNAFYEFESGRRLSPAHRIDLEDLKQKSEEIIRASKRGSTFDSHVNEGIIKTLIEKEKRLGQGLNNWILVFDWNTGSFIYWDSVSRDPGEAIGIYVKYEKEFSSEMGYEVVLLGSSNVATVRQTHSHYFGVENRDAVLGDIGESLIGFSQKVDLDIGARQILLALSRKNLWGKRTVSSETLRNHYCQNILTYESSFQALVEKGFILTDGGVSLSLRNKSDIDGYL